MDTATMKARQEQAQELVKKAREKRLLFDVPGYEEAAPLLREAVDLDPNCALAYAELAETYAYWGFRREICGQESDSLYEMAYASAVQAVTLDPELPQAHRAMALALRRGKRADAKRRADEVAKALERGPDDPETILEGWRVNGYDPDDPDIARVTTLAPRLIAARIDRGAVLCELERYTEALRELEQALESNPRNAQAYYDAAMVLDRMGKRDRARLVVERARRARPDDRLLEQAAALLEEGA